MTLTRTWGYDLRACNIVLTLQPGERIVMDIGEERKMVEFDPLETETPAPVETPTPPTPVEAPAEEPVGV